MPKNSQPPTPSGPPRPRPPLLADFARTVQVTTRWADDDSYGHVNNVTFYSYVDTAVNQILIEDSGVDIRALPAIGVVAETQCQFLRELRFPAPVTLGVGTDKVGRSSVVYRVALYQGQDPEPAAIAKLVHVYVDRTSRKPTAIPPEIRSALAPLKLAAPGDLDARPNQTMETSS